MATWSSSLFVIVFLGQIFLISYYFPNKLLGRMRYILKTYPPADYPKLYPKPTEHYRTAHRLFSIASRAIFVLGFVFLFAIAFLVDHSSFADDGYISEAWPVWYGLIQFLPLMAVELSEMSHLKLMRISNSSSQRKADLRRRRLTDVVSPTLLALAVLLYLGSLFFDMYAHDFAVTWGHDTVQRGIVLTVTNLLLVAVGGWNLYGRKQDPYQSSDDRVRRVTTALRSLLYVSMAMSIYFMTVAADDLYNLDALDATLISLYFQAIAFLSIGHVCRSIKPDDIDFDVYKSDAAVT